METCRVGDDVSKTFGDWTADKRGIWRTDDPDYFIDRARFAEESLHEWLKQLSQKDYFDEQSKRNFIEAYVHSTKERYI